MLFERVSQHDDDGDVGRAIRYAIPTDNFSMTSCFGPLETGSVYLRSDISRSHRDDQDG